MNVKMDDIKDWIEKADHDLGSAKVIYLYLPEYFDTIAFHCQQAVEKYLKALLIFFQIDFIRTHDLIYLLERISEKVEIEESRFQKAFFLSKILGYTRVLTFLKILERVLAF